MPPLDDPSKETSAGGLEDGIGDRRDTPMRTPRRVRLDELPADVGAVGSGHAGVERRRFVGDRLELIAYRYEAGAVFPRHQHDAEQWTQVTTGTLVFVLDDGEIKLEAGDAAWIPGGVPHGAYVPPSQQGPTDTWNVFSPARDAPPDATALGRLADPR